MVEINKTTKYLFIPIAYEDSSFISMYNTCYKAVKLYVDDYEYPKKVEHALSPYCLFFHFSKKMINNFDKCLVFFRTCSNYIDDYVINEDEHMIVFSVKEQFKKNFRKFAYGEYSTLYDDSVIENYFRKHSSYYLKYKSIPITLDNMSGFTSTSLVDMVPYMEVSPYHVLKNTDVLRDIIAKGLNVNADLVRELDCLPTMDSEIFRCPHKRLLIHKYVKNELPIH